MAKQDNDSKLFIGLLIGGAVCLGAVTLFIATRRNREPLNRIGEVVVRIGEILGAHDIDPAPLKRMEKKIHAQESSIAEIVDWVAIGLSLWKKFKG